MSVKSKWRVSRLLEQYIQVFFYSALFTIVFKFFVNGVRVGNGEFLFSFIPVLSKRYWYFTSYFGLFLLTPFLNKMIKSLSKRAHFILSVTVFILFSVMTVFPFSATIGGDLFSVNLGYSLLWLAALYIIGSFLGRYLDDFSSVKQYILPILYFICVYFAFLSIIAFRFLFDKIPVLETYPNVKAEMMITYNSPFIVLSSICLFLFFARLKVKRFKKFILKISRASFGVYLISEHSAVKNFVMEKRFVPYINAPFYELLLRIAIHIIIVYAACTIIDLLRIRLFNFLKVSKLCKKADGITEKIITYKPKKTKE